MKVDRLIDRHLWLRWASSLAGLLIAGVFLSACGTSTGQLAVGDRAPDFTLPSASGEQVSLSDFREVRPVLLYFHMADG